MADFNLIINDNHDADLIASVDDSSFNGLLSDEVVMQWLMDLEAEDSAADLEESRDEMTARRLQA
ncbi:hypothetical protein [Wenzhouxiangella marina]|uniref:Uncharacterized protein n=1 Tax=Wenzhouxiangella marina TaxID=1579979 RepID=A0A0K0Y0C3_9GAMM|nr:hypothetical protein [Wenzhouxiangella marina]AKS43337.1 hypothetical protein WM2015_2984 [Wenzhouxiangella marina]MBB6088548.1 hypothetical protein [Wenzhouxiangella marina]